MQGARKGVEGGGGAQGVKGGRDGGTDKEGTPCPAGAFWAGLGGVEGEYGRVSGGFAKDLREFGGTWGGLWGIWGIGERGTQRAEGAQGGGTDKEGALSPEGAFGQALWGFGGVLVDLRRLGGIWGIGDRRATEDQRWPGRWHIKRRGFKPWAGIWRDFEEAQEAWGGQETFGCIGGLKGQWGGIGGDSGYLGGHWGDLGIFGETLGGHWGYGRVLWAREGFSEHWRGFGELRGGHTDFRGALGTLGRPLGIVGRHWGLWEALGTWGVQPPPTSAFTLRISFSSSSGIIFPLRGRDRDGDTAGPRDLGPARTSQHAPLVCLHQVNVVCANSQESSSFLDGIMALGRKTAPGLGGSQEPYFG